MTMKTPTPIMTASTVGRHSRNPRLLLLLTALALVCGGSTLGPSGGGHEPQAPRAPTQPGVVQNDTAHQLAAKLTSLNGVVRAGLGLFLCGLLSLGYPPLRALVRGANARVALLLGGVALMVLPSLIVGNELLVLGTVGLVLGGWFLARQGRPTGRARGSNLHL
jgi:hypothetical protein